MHSNLMGPAGFYFHIEKRKALISPARPIKRQGAPPASHNRHPGAITWVAGDRLIDAAGAGFKAAMDQGHIGLRKYLDPGGAQCLGARLRRWREVVGNDRQVH